MNTKQKVILTGIVLGLVSSLMIVYWQNQKTSSTSTPGAEAVSTVIIQHTSSERLTREVMIGTANTIFVGQITHISPTSWNQNSGDFWNDGFLLHTIDIQILQFIAAQDIVSDEQTITITVLGNSPIETPNDDHLQVGEQGIFFIKETEIAWKEGNKVVNSFLGVPSDSYFLLGGDGLYHGRANETPVSLEELIQQISDQREILPQS